jgi:transcription antitermination factor NusG
MLQENLEFSSTNGSGAWHALYTRHQHEKVAAEFLVRQGFETFLPLYTAVHRWKDRTKELSVPLFPNYVFLRDGVGHRLQILKTPGVHAIVESGGRPGIIPDSEIAAIRSAVENLLRIEPHPFLTNGDWVRIKSGPLSGLEGILVRKQDRIRLVLSVEMLGRSVAVEVDALSVERVHKRMNGNIPADLGRNLAGWRHSSMSKVLNQRMS